MRPSMKTELERDQEACTTRKGSLDTCSGEIPFPLKFLEAPSLQKERNSLGDR